MNIFFTYIFDSGAVALSTGRLFAFTSNVIHNENKHAYENPYIEYLTDHIYFCLQQLM